MLQDEATQSLFLPKENYASRTARSNSNSTIGWEWRLTGARVQPPAAYHITHRSRMLRSMETLTMRTALHAGRSSAEAVGTGLMRRVTQDAIIQRFDRPGSL